MSKEDLFLRFLRWGGPRSSVSRQHLLSTLTLLEEGRTVPFLVRYRKDLTGGMDASAMRTLQQSFGEFTHLENRQASILGSIQEQGKLSAELERRIRSCGTLRLLEDMCVVDYLIVVLFDIAAGDQVLFVPCIQPACIHMHLARARRSSWARPPPAPANPAPV